METLQDRIKLNEQITVGAQPNAEQLEALAKEGFKSIVNLRLAEEKSQTMSPVDEGDKAQHLGLMYHHLPVTADGLKPAQVDRFSAIVAELETPIFVHCQKGKRAAAVALMHLAVQEGLSGQQALDKAQQLGFPIDNPTLKETIKSYVDRPRA